MNESLGDIQTLEELIQVVQNDVRKTLVTEIRALIRISGPMMKQLDGQQACDLLCSVLEGWSSEDPLPHADPRAISDQGAAPPDTDGPVSP